MTMFAYIAVDSKGSSFKGTVEQPDRTSVINAITKQNLRPISIKEVTVKDAGSSIGNILGGNKVKADQLVMFTRQLAAMVGAGVPLLRALTALAEHITESPVLQKILRGVIQDVEGGSALGDALAKYPNAFNDIYVNMVRAGEAAGILDDILNRLALQQEKNTAMRKRIKSAMMYPMVLMVITTLAFFGLMIFIVPQIGKIIKDLGGADAKMPAITEFMLGVSGFMVSYWYIVAGGMAALIYGFFTYIRTPKGRYQFHFILLKTPIIKSLITKVAVGYFTRTFSALIEAGVSVLEALDVTSRAVGNAIFEQALVEAEAEVKVGKSLSSVIESKDIFPPIVPQMLLVGEETGQTASVLIKVADFYEEEVDRSIEGLGAIVEPIMIVIMGGMVGLVAASVMLPIAGLSQTIK
ncbi:type II secretion system F family protein [Candidatus Saccharibacteria bacterium]|nr:type II secretion system F family protein [Candidatus Saccharibacteria bacterium]